ncbi:MAG TPA: polysaccharide lyase family protein, partial [Paludibacter sp.]|nr:polysaccharide lyase family protein [Paludibacter sp.]
VNGNNVSINNSMITAEIVGGRMTTLNPIGQANLLNNGGFGYFTYVDNVGSYSPANLTPIIKINNTEIADIFYKTTDNFNIEMHYVFRKNESGFFVYYIASGAGPNDKELNSLRFALRVDKDIFNYAWTKEREGEMIHPDKLANNIQEIQDATYLLQDSTIYTKYDWAVEKIHDSLHGLIGNGRGVWNIEASHEYSNSGTTAQELTLHGTDTTPILLSQFFSTHFGGENIVLKDEYNSWGKIFGPHFIYLNSGTNDAMITDGKLKASEMIAQWPYNWLNDSIYPLERGTLSSKLNMAGHGKVDSAMVLLCKSGPAWLGENDHWQKQPYDYMFWSIADQTGNFVIDNIRPGTYTLYAYTQKGKLIDELRKDNITVNKGQNSLGTIEWNANDKQKTIFQIGTANHKSSEYKLANLPLNYGRWKESPYSLTYDVETDKPAENWYYCQRVGSLWTIRFYIDDPSTIINPVLKVGIAGSDASPHLDMILNGKTVSKTDMGSDSGIRRSSMSGGKYSLVSCNVDKNLLVSGINTLEMKCYGTANEYKGIMYDAILLEADTIHHDTSINSSFSSQNPKIEIHQNSFSNIIDIKANIKIGAIFILDLLGKIIFQKTYDLASTISITDLNFITGIYIIQLVTPDMVYSQKMIFNKYI